MAALQSLIFLSRKTRIKTGWDGGFDRLNHQLRQAQLVKQGLRRALVETRYIASLHTYRHLKTYINFTPNKKKSLYILRILRKNNTFVTDLQKMSLFPLFENKAIL
ncbi:MAG: hypothetical protein IKX38_01950 [Bacteroidales bacterium]|nr:hypothetical protein [Bacteroidales bacterium]